MHASKYTFYGKVIQKLFEKKNKELLLEEKNVGKSKVNMSRNMIRL